MYSWQETTYVGYLVVQQEVVCGSYRLYPTVKPIHMTALLEYLAKNENVSILIG